MLNLSSLESAGLKTAKLKAYAIATGLCLLAGAVLFFVLRSHYISQGEIEGNKRANAAEQTLATAAKKFDSDLLICKTGQTQLTEVLKKQNENFQKLFETANKMQAQYQQNLASLDKKNKQELDRYTELANIRTKAAIEEQCNVVDALLKKEFEKK